jgi:hypothetical protein
MPELFICPANAVAFGAVSGGHEVGTDAALPPVARHHFASGVGVGADATAQRSRAASVPILSNSHNCTREGSVDVPEINRLQGSHRRMAFVLTHEIQALAKEFGLERLGFLTLTIGGKVRPRYQDLVKRFHSLNTHVIAKRYPRAIRVFEPGTLKGRWHAHLVVVLPEDVRTSFDFVSYEIHCKTYHLYSAGGKKDARQLAMSQKYKSRYIHSATGYLRSEWAFWRKTSPLYGFGRTELIPIRTTAEGIAVYVGGYVGKCVRQREQGDKGMRIVQFLGYKPGDRKGSAKFGWVSPGGWLWRKKLEVFSATVGAKDLAELRRLFGPSWAHTMADGIMGVDLVAELGEVTYPDAATAVKDYRDVPTNYTGGPVTIRGEKIERRKLQQLSDNVIPKDLEDGATEFLPVEKVRESCLDEKGESEFLERRREMRLHAAHLRMEADREKLRGKDYS